MDEQVLATPAGAPQLERLLGPLERPELDSCRGEGPPAWLHAGKGDWRLLARPRLGVQPHGEPIESFALDSGTALSALRLPSGSVYVPFDLNEAYGNYVTEAWRGSAPLRALSQRQLAYYYRVKHLLPRAFWLRIRRAFIRFGKPPAFPAWPLEHGVERLLRFYALCLLLAGDAEEARFRWFWPGSYRAALILTHDVETADGLRLALELADLEQDRGLRSSFNVVAAQYPVDQGVIRELNARGFEIGLHGLRHDRSLFSSRTEFERQLPALGEAAKRFGAEGFRSPATHRVLEWLPELPVSYDCTVPHSDPYEPQPGGCCSIWPFLLGSVVELPYTLPQDHTLFTLLRRRSVQPWLEQARAIEERFGLIQCISHPDRGYLGDRDQRAIYRELLDALSEREQLWKPLPRDLAAWWRRREIGTTQRSEQRFGTMRRGGASEFASFEPPASD